MTERLIFRNIQHVPKVWGVTYSRLFASLGIGLLTTTAGFALSSSAGAIGKISIICLGAVITCSLYGICYWLEHQDTLDKGQPFLKNAANSQSMSQQRIRIYQGKSNALS
jgi:hypothetical protein